MTGCIFCKIAKRKAPATRIKETKEAVEMVFLAQWVVQKLRTKFGQEDIHIESWNGGAVQNPRHFHIHVCAEYGPSVPEADGEYFINTKKKFIG